VAAPKAAMATRDVATRGDKRIQQPAGQKKTA
jgi:hypothetical protein